MKVSIYINNRKIKRTSNKLINQSTAFWKMINQGLVKKNKINF